MATARNLLQRNDPDVYAALAGEERRQAQGIELIPSEHCTYPEVLAALGSAFTKKYSEGYPGRRYYGGRRLAPEHAVAVGSGLNSSNRWPCEHRHSGDLASLQSGAAFPAP